MLTTLLRGKHRGGSEGMAGGAGKSAGASPAPRAPSSPPPAVDLDQLARIAHSAVLLAELGPKLASLAAEMEKQARAQSAGAQSMAATMDGLTRDLEGAVAALRASSGQMQDAVATVDRVADHTRLLSINASIEAARAGEEGKAFAVVVDEVKQLADRTGKTTLLIGERMEEIRTGITRVAAVACAAEAKSAERAGLTVGEVNRQVRTMAGSAVRQLEGAESVHSMGDQVNGLTESLLLSVGKFRFDAHSRAQEAVEALVPALVAVFGDRAETERALERWLAAHPHFELAYLTNARGRQTIDNIGWRDGRVGHDPAGFGKDWSNRPWYRTALDHAGPVSTDVYRSTATGDFCFTVAAALRDPRGALLGVFGSDVNFQRLVAQ